MKLMHDSKATEGLKELINKYDSKEEVPDAHHAARKIGKHKVRIG